MTPESTREAPRSISRPEAIRRLSGVVDDLSRYVDYLREEGVTEVDRSPAPAEPSVDVGAELKAVARVIAGCKKCALHEKRRRTVPGQGHVHPDILFVGEGPGEDEDRQGLAFVGRAGQLLTRLITRMGYTREDVFIANIVKCRPPINRKPLPEEMAACFPYLEKQIALLKPRVIVALGATAVEALVSPLARISRLRGTWQTFGDIPLMPTYHPSYLLRNQSAMWDVWNDMRQVLAHLGRTPPPASAKRKS